jgi:hypothetical protein
MILPEFRKAVSGTKSMVRKLERLVGRVENYGYTSPKKRRSNRRNKTVESGVQESGYSGGTGGTGVGSADQT